MASLAAGPGEMTHLHQLLEELEAVAEEVLCDRQEIISLDRRRNTNREALRALRNSSKARTIASQTATTSTPANTSHGEGTKSKIKEISSSSIPGTMPVTHDSLYSSKTWMCIGDMFMRMPNDVLMEAIEKEQHQLDTGIGALRDGLRGKVNTLRRLEGDEPSKGTFLSPLSREEWAGVQQVLGPNA